MPGKGYDKRLLVVLSVTIGLSSCGQTRADGVPDLHAEAGTAGVSAANGASGSLNFAGTGPDTIPEPPTYDRSCLEALLANAGAAPDGAGGAASDIETSARGGEAGSGSGEGGSGVDLELGAGDLTLLVVFDKSGSMRHGWDRRSKWQVANEALMKAIDPVIENLTIGTIFFPQPGGCDVAALDSGLQMSYAPGPAFAATWQETANSRGPNGSTPLELALRYADMAIERGCGFGLLKDRFRVVLITDGEPTCEDDTEAVVALAAEWSELGVETWVMGLPGSSAAAELLDAIAAAGGTEKAMSLGTPTELDEGLAAAAK